MFHRLPHTLSRASLAAQFGVRSASQVGRDVLRLLGRASGGGVPLDLGTAGLFRPELSLPAYAGLVPDDGLSPVFNFFDRTAGGRAFRGVATRARCRDFRGARLTYDEHDGTDFVCPPGTPLVAAAPGVLTASRDCFLRGGLTACVDHGHGVVTQYTHMSRLVAEIGAPLARGDVIGLSGTAGIDMVGGFPWVPPHIHFMVWVGGRPVDPYLAAGDAARPGTWLHRNDPRPSAGLADDPSPPRLGELLVDLGALERVIGSCKSPGIRDELAAASSDASRAAICEDSLHHDRDAWPVSIGAVSVRTDGDAARVRITLPLPASIYRGARVADAMWTRPRASSD